jgi:hypothetical protein
LSITLVEMFRPGLFMNTCYTVSSDHLTQLGISRSVSSTDYAFACVGLQSREARAGLISNASRRDSSIDLTKRSPTLVVPLTIALNPTINYQTRSALGTANVSFFNDSP